jgi:alanyl aminopeptidase
MAEDSRLTTHAIRQPVTNIDNLFEGIQVTYGKGATLDMFERWMGADTFRTAIRAYLKKYEWKNAVADDLWAEPRRPRGRMSDSDGDVPDQPGIPLVHAELLEGGQVKLTQRRFLGYGVAAPGEQHWGIPMTVRYPGATGVQSHSFLFDQPTATIQLPGLATKAAWIDLNAAGGYYRTSVEPAVLATLSSRAQEILSTPERIRFINNVGSLVLAGEVKGDDYLRTLQGFAKDPRPEVVNALIGSLGQVKGAFITTDLETPFSGYVRQVLGPAAQRFGWDRKNGEEEAVSILRPTLLDWMADEGRDDAALTRAEQLAQSFRADRGSIDPSLVNVALRLSAIRGKADLYEEYQKRSSRPRRAHRSRSASRGDGSFRDPALQGSRPSRIAGTDGSTTGGPTVAQAAVSRLENREVVAAWQRRTTRPSSTRSRRSTPCLSYMGFACEQLRARSRQCLLRGPEHSAPGMDLS